MQILYYFAEDSRPMSQWQRMHIIDELQRHGISIETFNPLLCENVEQANENVVKKIKSGKFDLFMSNLGYHKMLFPETVELIKQFGVPTLRIAWDNLMIPYLDKKLVSHFDLIWLTAKETQRLYEKWGARCIFLPYAANPYTYRYESEKINRRVCFIGNPHGSRAIMINKLTKGGIPVDLYHGKGTRSESNTVINIKYKAIGPSPREAYLNRLFFHEGRKLILGSLVNKIKGQTFINNNSSLTKFPGLSHEGMVKVYAESALSLASSSAGHTDVLKNPLPIINLRNFEIPMCGGIELCKYNEELASYFEEGKEIILYRSEDELLDKAKFIIRKASEQDILQIKSSARKRAEAEHTWMCRFNKVFEALCLNI